MCKSLKLGLLAFAVLGIAFLGCDKLANPIVETPDDPGKVETAVYPYVTDIMAGQNIDVGDITVYWDVNNIYVKYTTTGLWHLTEYHVAVESTCDFSKYYGRNGNPAPGRFPYKDEFWDEPVQQVIVPIPWGGLWDADELCLMAHCVVFNDADNDNQYDELEQEETGWGEGDSNPGNDWSMHFCLPVEGKALRLPPQGFSVQFLRIVNGEVPASFNVWGITGDYDLTNGIWNSFCLDHGIYIYNQHYHPTLYTSYDLNMPSYAKYVRNTTPPNSVLVPYDKINWLLNYMMISDPLPFEDANVLKLQHIFWHWRGDPLVLTPAEVQLEGLADQFGEGFVPKAGQWMAVLMDNGTSVQLTFLIVDP